MVRRLVVCALLLASTARAERLPLRAFTTADGLANNMVLGATQDPHGFVWFATYEGVSRFDSKRFESYGLADGLPAATTYAVLATPDGAVWAATDAGLAVLDRAPTMRPHFRALTSVATLALAADPDGGVWAGTARGLQHVDARGTVTDLGFAPGVLSIAHDPRDHSLWLGTWHGLAHRTARGEVTRWALGAAADDRVFGVLVARDGTVWAGSVAPDVVQLPSTLAPSPTPLLDTPGVTRYRTLGGARRGFLQDAAGTVWIGTTLNAYRWTAAKPALEPLGPEVGQTAILEDSAGNLWFGSDARGAVRVERDGFVAFDAADGFLGDGAYGFAIDREGALAVAVRHPTYVFAQRRGDRFASLELHAPNGDGIGTWPYGDVIVAARDGRWWLPTAAGVVRYPVGAALDAGARGELLPGLTGAPLHLYEDRRGDVWIATADPTALVRWDRATDRPIATTAPWPHAIVQAFAEDARGDLWVAYEAQLVRVHAGEPRVFAAPLHGLSALRFDAAGRLWCASEGEGVARLDDPDHPERVTRRYRRAELGSDQALSLVEDRRGRIYVGTSVGIARVDPASGEVVRFTTADGLPGSYVQVATRTPDGALWFGMSHGLARLWPEGTRVVEAPRIFITRLAIGGAWQPLDPDGETHVRAFELAYDATGVDVEVASPQFAIDAGVRFQYRLDGAWSEPIDEPALHFGRLAPGTHALEVRAVDARGVTSPSAAVTFEVIPPVWRRGWFLALASFSLAGALYAWHRRRVAHVLALERVRRRIARDLHDELGSSLSRISILSEVARRSTDAPPRLGGQLDAIGSSARELVDVASDIVWSTDPGRDDLHSVIVRLRSFAADVFDGRGIAWSLVAPDDPDTIKLDPERRRHLYLVLKEAIANAAEHAAPSRVDISLGVERGRVVARVRDDGKGFDEATLNGTGNGLANMRARAAEAGGSLAVRHDGGTEIELRL